MLENWNPEYDVKIDKLDANDSKTRLSLYEDFINKYNIYSSFLIEKKLKEDGDSSKEKTYKNEVELKYNKEIENLEKKILENPSIIEIIDIDKQRREAEERAKLEAEEQKRRDELNAISDAQKKYYTMVYNNYYIKDNSYFEEPNEEMKRIRFSGELLESVLNNPLKEYYLQTLEIGGLKDIAKVDAFKNFLNEFFKNKEKEQKEKEKEEQKRAKELEKEDQDDLEENNEYIEENDNNYEKNTESSTKIINSKPKTIFNKLDKEILNEDIDNPLLENVSAPQEMIDTSKVVKIYNEIPANSKVKVKKGKNGKLNVPENDVPGLIITHSVLPSFLKKNETVKSILNQFQNDSIRTIGKLKDRYTLDAFRALKKEKIKTKDIREVRFFDNEIIFITGNASKRIGKEVELGNGIDLSQLWDFDSPGFKGLKNLITLQLTRKFMYKMLKDLNLNQTQAVSQICKYSFKQFKHLDNIVIQGLPVLTRTQYEIQMTKFEDKLKQQENYIKQQEYNTAMDKAMQDTFTTNTKTSSIGKPVTDAKGITFYDDLLEYIATKRRNQIQKKKSKGGFFKSVFKGIKWFFLG